VTFYRVSFYRPSAGRAGLASAAGGWFGDRMTERMSPSVCRKAKRKTARIVSAMVIARAE
jgi:hypothetical protein